MPSPPEGHKPNRLIDETSPYLLQHAYNPVEWYPWGPEALERAKAEDKLILLSIGYSACHWCHVMERESFENESIAAKMNAHYVNIKVDREERPDIDDIYMAATVVMNAGQGGWPMTVILTPDLEPVFAGTYFPPDDSHGRAGFPRILSEIDRVWHGDRERVIGQARQFAEQLRNHRDLGPALTVGVEQLVLAGRQLTDSFDPIFGGFGGAPKFPPSMGVRLLMRLHRRFGEPHFLHMAVHTLERMAAGGLYDHVGGGFCRYATDKKWLVPHFEKMLYDNALLVPAYLEAFQITKHDHFRQVARETLDYILREMTGDHGGFFTATDADSEGEEGKFFVWQPDEVDQILEGDEATFFKTYYDITPSGNWEGKSIPNTPKTIEECAKGMGISAERARELTNTAKRKVYEARLRRVPPGLDDKVLTAWNGLMIGALADGYRVIGEPAYLVAAERAADFLRTTLVGSDDRLLRTYRLGKAHLPGYLEDYAYLINGLIDLYEAGGALRHLVWAKQLVHTMLQAFGDLENGAFFHTAVGQEDLIMRYRDGSDGATPSPNAMAALALVRLSRHTDDRALRDAGVRALRAYGRPIAQFARGFSTSLMVVDMLLEEPLEIAVAAHGDWEAWRTELAEHFLPNRVQAIIPLDQEDDATWPLRTGKVPVGGQSTAYVCRNFSCEAPLTDPSDFAGVLQESTGRSFATISRSIAGFATKEGTRGFADRFAMPGYRALGSTELTVSVVGFGGYRVDDVVDTHREALERAMASGINVIDTSSNYVDGASERLAGSVVRSMIDEGDIARDELVIVSKLGYLQGQNYRAAEERERREQAYPEVVKVQEGLWHSIHPVVLADQLAGSLARLEIETLDVCLLHNPEYFLNNDDDVMRTLTDRRNEFYRRVTEAFRFFESAVHEGQIRCYGVSSNTLAFSDDAPDSVSLAALIECAEHAAGNTHHFRVIQLPLNVLESAAAISENSGPERNVSTLTYAQHQGLGVLVNRPLNAFRESMYRLADVTVLGVPIDIDVQADKLLRLEESFLTAIGGANAAAMGLDAEVEDAFHWGEELRSLGLHPLSIEQWAHIAGQVQRSVARASSMLDRRMNPEESSPWLEWRDRYFTALGVMLGELRRRAAELGHRQTQAIAATIDPVLPSSVHHESLSRKALWIVASTPGVSCVLNGMRTPEYVRDAAGVMEWDILPDPYAAYRALGDWRGT